MFNWVLERYSLEDSPSRRLDQGTPQLADMFKVELI